MQILCSAAQRLYERVSWWQQISGRHGETGYTQGRLADRNAVRAAVHVGHVEVAPIA